jgi:hypothetical protein
MNDKVKRGFLLKFADATVVDDLTRIVVPFGDWKHPFYGEEVIDKTRADRFATNFKNNAFGNELHGNYDHGLDAAKGNKASAWVKDVDVTDDGLALYVKFTDTAREEVERGEWRYISPEWYDEFENPATRETHHDVLAGFALTNVPFLRGIAPINMSDLVLEVADQEHRDPGEPLPPPQDPVATPPPQDDDSRTKSNEKAEVGEQQVDELETYLRELFEIDSETDLKEALSPIADEAKALKVAKDQTEEMKTFKEKFPAEWERLHKLEAAQRKQDAKSFADTFRHGERGLAPTTLELVEEAYEKDEFSAEKVKEILAHVLETGTVKYGEVGTTQVPDDDGSATGDQVQVFADKIAQIQRESDGKMTYQDAYLKVATENPELLKAYMDAIPGKRSA